jgi:hypothetical protein
MKSDKSFFAAQETINRGKRKHTEQEKILANNTSDKELISKIFKECKPLSSINANVPSELGRDGTCL